MPYMTIDFTYDQKDKKEKLDRITQKTWNFFIRNARRQRGFENREGQQNMALDIIQAIESNQHIAVEAGVGIGKSFAYLVPALLYNREFATPVAIATSTIALQEQLKSDIKVLKKLLNLHPEVILAKGQTHYVCRMRADNYLSQKKDKLTEILRRDIKQGKSDRRDFDYDIENKIWENINIRDYGHKTCDCCHYKKRCSFKIMRDAMISTNGIVLCNQDLLTVHLQKISGGFSPLFNPKLSLIVIDEAHNLEDKVRNVFIKRYSKEQIMAHIVQASKGVRKHGTNIDVLIDKLNLVLDKFYDHLQRLIRIQINTAMNDMKYADRFFLPFDDETKLLIKDTYRVISRISEIIQLHSAMNKRLFDAAIDEVITIENFFAKLNQQNKKNLYWLEQNNKSVGIVSCPKNTAALVSRLYFENEKYRTIMTSATLTNTVYGSEEEKYAYFISNTGFPIKNGKGFLSEPKPSPFPYDEHAMIYYCADLPHPTKQHKEFMDKAVIRLVELFEISHGKALVLFTAKSDLEQVYKLLSGMNLPYKILKQQGNSSQEKITGEFREDTDSVLLGTGAYWEGINIKGESLSNLIIFRLPFPVPDPIIQYKGSMAKDALMDVNVPEMILKLKQGIGRLIRNFDDKGIVSIVDPRLNDDSTAPYKDMVWAALPIHNRTSSLEEIRTFYRKLF